MQPDIRSPQKSHLDSPPPDSHPPLYGTLIISRNTHTLITKNIWPQCLKSILHEALLYYYQYISGRHTNITTKSTLLSCQSSLYSPC
uniref:Uncharacterized protein n=1 Tax=Rhizophora mucronata TaxID=61149 RepID=A0A2P2Q9C7_RHIMU